MEPKKAVISYKAGHMDPRSVQAPPADLRIIASVPHASWRCRGAGEVRVPETPLCASGEMLWLAIVFPNCWDGIPMDSPDHRSHMAYGKGGTCPSTHPVPLPSIKLQIQYHTSGGRNVVFAPARTRPTPTRTSGTPGTRTPSRPSSGTASTRA